MASCHTRLVPCLRQGRARYSGQRRGTHPREGREVTRADAARPAESPPAPRRPCRSRRRTRQGGEQQGRVNEGAAPRPAASESKESEPFPRTLQRAKAMPCRLQYRYALVVSPCFVLDSVIFQKTLSLGQAAGGVGCRAVVGTGFALPNHWPVRHAGNDLLTGF